MSDHPELYQRMKQQHPDVLQAYESLGEAVKNAGPLDGKTAALVKLGISLAGELEGATHSAVRKALVAGCTPDECRHVSLLAMTTLGFPSTMRARTWIEDVLNR